LQVDDRVGSRTRLLRQTLGFEYACLGFLEPRGGLAGLTQEIGEDRRGLGPGRPRGGGAPRGEREGEM